MASSRNHGAVLVTGASRGLGLEIALSLAECGFTVWAGARDPEGSGIGEAAARRNVRIKTVALDVTDDQSVNAAMARIEREEASLYGLVNNAGVTARCCFEEFPEDRIQRIFAVNTFGPMRVTRSALPLMRRGGSGRIVMVSSIGGRIGAISVAPYAASKFALEGFAESLSLELRFFGISVTLVEPGMVKTEIWDDNRIVPEAHNRRSPYYSLFWSAEQLAGEVLRTSKLKPADVARAVVRTMTRANPPLRQVVGRRAGLVLALRRLSGSLFERFYFGAQVRMIRKRMDRLAAQQ